jgi:lipopolysaccharide export system permease protein
MTLLDRYLFKQFSQLLLLTFAALLAIYLLVDFFEKIDNFLAAGKSVTLAARYLLLKTPQILEQLLPVCLLLAGVLTMGVLNYSHEFMALNAGGISTTRTIMPLIAGAALYTLLALISAQWVQPSTISLTNRIWYEEIKRQVPKGIIRDGRTFHNDERGIYSFVRDPDNDDLLHDFTYTEWDNSRRLRFLLTAETASWAQNSWTFTNGQFKTRKEDGEYDIASFDNSGYSLAAKPADFFVPPHKEEEASLSDLFRKAGRSKKHDALGSRAVLQRRLSYLFLGFPLLLIGIPVLLVVHRGRGKDLALAVPVSCGIAFLAWGWWSVAQTLAVTGIVPLLPASWSIHLVAGLGGAYLIFRRDM